MSMTIQIPRDRKRFNSSFNNSFCKNFSYLSFNFWDWKPNFAWPCNNDMLIILLLLVSRCCFKNWSQSTRLPRSLSSNCVHSLHARGSKLTRHNAVNFATARGHHWMVSYSYQLLKFRKTFRWWMNRIHNWFFKIFFIDSKLQSDVILSFYQYQIRW